MSYVIAVAKAALVGTIVGLTHLALLYRRRWRALLQERAQEVANALTGTSNVVDGVELPDPNDSRWVLTVEPWFSVTGARKGEVQVLRLDQTAVDTTRMMVYVADLPPLNDGAGYARRVLTAYRQRKADQTRKGRP